jgi:hypothetical protein
MSKLWRGIVNTIFWSYERGSWPYDVMVVLIVLFVLVTPRRWFHDQSQAGTASDSGVTLVAQDPASRTYTYQIDPKVFPSERNRAIPGPELERETHELLSRRVDALKGQTFQIRSITPVRGADGSVQYYAVELAH